MRVTLQYFDGCPNWKEVASSLEALKSKGFEFEVDLQLIDTPELAEEYGFRGSPTIVVDGVDPFADPEAPVGLSCRVYQTDDGFAGSPSFDQLREAISKAS